MLDKWISVCYNITILIKDVDTNKYFKSNILDKSGLAEFYLHRTKWLAEKLNDFHEPPSKDLLAGSYMHYLVESHFDNNAPEIRDDEKELLLKKNGEPYAWANDAQEWADVICKKMDSELGEMISHSKIFTELSLIGNVLGKKFKGRLDQVFKYADPETGEIRLLAIDYKTVRDFDEYQWDNHFQMKLNYFDSHRYNWQAYIYIQLLKQQEEFKDIPIDFEFWQVQKKEVAGNYPVMVTKYLPDEVTEHELSNAIEIYDNFDVNEYLEEYPTARASVNGFSINDYQPLSYRKD